jgi:nucleotide-binding universal stress UspA family protein
MSQSPDARPRCIVVGYDGSPPARTALRYAARRAVGEGDELIVLFAFSAPPEWIGTPFWDESIDTNRGHGQRLLAELPDDIVATAPIERELVAGPPAEVLANVAEARDAEEIVVGSRGFGPFRATLGSVAHALLHRASRPVVVIPARMLGAEGGREPHRIVVGYDGSPTAKDALGHAAYRAGPGGELIAVYAYRPPFEHYDSPLVEPALRHNREAAEAALQGISDDMVAGLPVKRVSIETPAAQALVNVSQTEQAGEIVVGSRGLGRFRAALGSVSHALLHEADRPVVVVPHEQSAEEAEIAQRVRLARNIRFRHTRV